MLVKSFNHFMDNKTKTKYHWAIECYGMNEVMTIGFDAKNMRFDTALGARMCKTVRPDLFEIKSDFIKKVFKTFILVKETVVTEYFLDDIESPEEIVDKA